MSDNSGSGQFGQFIAENTRVSVPIYHLLAAIGHLEDCDEQAQATARTLADYLPSNARPGRGGHHR